MNTVVIIGIGCDCIEIERFRKGVERTDGALLVRLFTPNEISLCQQHADPIFRYAGRFVAKEALAKALGCGIGSALSWHDIEILNDNRGKPVVHWQIDIAARFGVERTHLSISHSHTIAMAYATLEGLTA